MRLSRYGRGRSPDEAEYPRVFFGQKIIQYLRRMAGNTQRGSYEQYSAHTAKTCLGMVATDMDDHPFLDYLNPEFLSGTGEPMAGSERNMTDLAKRAYHHVVDQQKKWQTEKNLKLALRYLALSRYFEARLQQSTDT